MHCSNLWVNHSFLTVPLLPLLFELSGTNDPDILKEADTLIYKVKSSGKNH